MNTLRTERLVLEPLVANHAAAMFAVLSDPAIYEFENAPPESLEWLKHRYERLESRRSADGSEQWLNWVIRLPSGLLAGYVQATVTRDAVAYVAYELGSNYWRQRIGSSAVRVVLEELATNYGVLTCFAVLKATNFRSKAMLRSLGFAPARQAELERVGCEQDELVMSRRCANGENAV